jgi:outer membrane protein assembly factor BamD (BamD/ComL family)
MPRWLHLTLTVLSALIFLGALGWLLVHTLKRTEDPSKLIFKWILSLLVLFGIAALALATLDSFGGVVVPFACVAVGVIFSIIWAPHLGAILASPLSSLYDGGNEEPVPEPLYSIAEAKRKRGRFHEAALDLRDQLKRFPTDYKGQMLLASLQAENLDDLPGAQLTIDRLCQQPGHPPHSIAMALNQLADWHLKYGQDAEAARATLERISQVFPSTELAVLAGERLAHLGGTAEQLAAAAGPGTVHLHPGVQNIGLLKSSAHLQPQAEDPAAAAARLIAQLEQHPQDSEAREQLALIYADHYRRLDLAADQLDQLILQPNQPVRQISRWTNLLTDLHIRHAGDAGAAGRALQRLVEMFPGTAAAAQAEQRLARLELEVKGQAPPTIAVKLGTYEQRLGLKKGWGAPAPGAGSQQSG